MPTRIVPQTVFTIPLKNKPLVTIEVGFRVGSGDERLGQGGIAHALEHLIFKSKQVGEWDNEAALLGGQIEARTSRDSTVFSVTVPRENSVQGAQLLQKMLIQPSFTASDWEKEQRVIASEEAIGASDAEKIGRAVLYKHFYAPSAYAEPIWGSAKSRATVTVNDIMAFYKTHYRPENRWVVLIGGFTPLQGTSVRGLFASTNNQATNPVVLSSPPLLPTIGKAIQILPTLKGQYLRGSATPPLTGEANSWKTHATMLLLARHQQATFLPGRQGGLFIVEAATVDTPLLLTELQDEAVNALATETGTSLIGNATTEQVARCYSLYAGMGAMGFLENKYYEKLLRQVTLEHIRKANQDIQAGVCVLKGEKGETK
jgi:predicted Zn-dependent peptidase